MMKEITQFAKISTGLLSIFGCLFCLGIFKWMCDMSPTLRLLYYCKTCKLGGLTKYGKQRHKAKGHEVVWDRTEDGEVKKVEHD